jgi:putative ABC transport system permease protein
MNRLLRFFRRTAEDSALKEEMRAHFDEKVDELMEGGMTRDAALREAHRRFGNVTSAAERSRDIWAYPWIENLAHDFRYALRMLVKNPMFAAVVVLPLALGIGANTAIFTIVDAALLRSLPYRQPDRLVHLFETKEDGTQPHEASYPDFQDWRGAHQFVEQVAGYTGYGLGATLSGAGEPERIVLAGVSPEFFPLLGVQAAKGRTFLPDEDQPGASRSAVLSDGLWRRRFGADPAIIGKSILLNGRPANVVGILPADFQFGLVGAVDLWMVALPSPNQRQRRYWHWMNAIARLKPGASVEQAQTEMNGVSAAITREDPKHAGTAIKVKPLQEVLVGNVRPVLLVLFGTIALVLLIACANVANLLLARSSSRQKEFAVRGSLGASRGRLVQQLLTESLTLALLGGALGIAVAHWGIRALVGAVPTALRSTMPFLDGLGLHWGMLGFTAAVSVATGVLFGFSPALRMSKGNFQPALQAGRRTSAGGEHQRVRRILLVSEVAISLILLIGAGLMIKSTARLLAVDPGFRPQNLLTMQVALPGVRYQAGALQNGFWARLLERIQALHGVSAVGTVSILPLGGGGNTGTMRIPWRPETALHPWEVNVRTISRGYLPAMGIPMLAGRAFDTHDIAGAPQVAMINQTLARIAFPGQNPLGKQIEFEWSGGPLQVVGVAADENTDSLDRGIRPVVYFPALQGGAGVVNIVVRAAGMPAALNREIRDEVRALDPEVAVYLMKTMEEVIADSPATVTRRYPAVLMSLFAVIALVMATVGTYGLVAYSVTQRTHEIGIRMALGAGSSDILRLVVGQGIALVMAGVVVGLAGAALLSRALTKLLFGVQPFDPAVFAAVSAILIAAAILASYIPARRAIRVPPVAALGSD